MRIASSTSASTARRPLLAALACLALLPLAESRPLDLGSSVRHYPRQASTISAGLSNASWNIVDAPSPTLAAGQNTTNPKAFLVYNADEVHYPFTVHLPDRTTRNLAPLVGAPPLLLSLSGSGARGPASNAKTLSGFDGASRKIRQYNDGNTTSPPHQLAAEEFLTVTPICPNETAQADANWAIEVMPNILAQVAVEYDVDLTRVYLSTYSMGARAAWKLLMAYPDIFAGSIVSSGRTSADTAQLSALLGNSIRNYYGGDDENNLANASLSTQQLWDAADAAVIQQLGTATAASLQARNSTANITIFEDRVLETVGPIPGADHLDMTDRPWDEDILTDGYAGALAWLLTQVKPEGAQLVYNDTVCTTCIPASSAGDVGEQDDNGDGGSTR